MRTAESNQKDYDGGLFCFKKVVDFDTNIDSHCRFCLEAIFTKFKIHAEPIVSTPDMQTLIEQAPSIFAYMCLYCLLR